MVRDTQNTTYAPAILSMPTLASKLQQRDPGERRVIVNRVHVCYTHMIYSLSLLMLAMIQRFPDILFTLAVSCDCQYVHGSVAGRYCAKR